ncbi:uncharacterized protein [Rutidosis leptorrhynchoides]|uniref:uncharacterized protein n=1 Tax=Rutidosis leptorrhynchoides TaxID=125765 RepID=UPI003A999C1E
MVDAIEKDEAPKSNSVPEAASDVKTEPQMNSEKTEVGFEVTGNMQEDEDEDGVEYDEEDDEDEDEEDEYEDEEDEYEEEDEEEVEEEKANDGGVDMNKEGEKGKAVVTVTESENGKAVVTVTEVTDNENAVKKDEKKVEVPKNGDELGENSKSKGNRRPRIRNRNKKKDEQNVLATNGDKPQSKGEQKTPNKLAAANGDKPESSSKKKGSKRVESMGMVFMCTSKTKTDCFRYKVLGLPGNKKDQVAKIYKGMRLFLFDVDLRLMYGIFKAAGPGGYNLEPKAFKSDFPSQVRFTVIDDCLPLAEEKFKGVLKENYYSRNKFEGLLKADQVKKLCKLFVEMGRGGARPKAPRKLRMTRPVETRRIRPVETRRSRADDAHPSKPGEKRKRREREQGRLPRSPPRREKRRYDDYERPHVIYERDPPPVIYERDPPVQRYLAPPPQPAISSPVRMYTYERPHVVYERDPPYIHERIPEHHRTIPEHHAYRVLDVEPRDRQRGLDPYQVYSRDAPSYRDPTAYTLTPREYHLPSREYNLPPVPTSSEYRLSEVGSTRVPSYRDVGRPSDYRSAAAAAAQLSEYRTGTHYRY